jgi:O-antigen ligase
MTTKLENIRAPFTKDNFVKMGFFAMAVTLFLMSFPRSWSLYSLGVFLTAGLFLWLLDFKNTRRELYSFWPVVAAPLLYFLINMLSTLIQNGGYNLLGHRMMFFLIPVFGFSVFINGYFRSRLPDLLRIFVLGIICISVFLLLRSLVVTIGRLSDGLSLHDLIKGEGSKFISLGFSVIEHPTYFSMKINFAILLLVIYSEDWGIRWYIMLPVYLLLSVTLFLVASKAGIAAWIAVSIVLIIRAGKKNSFRPVAYILMILILISMTVMAAKRLERVSYFFRVIRLSLTTEDHFMDLDQRAREWYTAANMIKEKPLSGYGLAKIEEKMVNKYREYGFEEEAQKKLNAHNQFLEAQVTFGIAGTISLLLMLAVPLIYRKRSAFKYFMGSFISLVIFYLLFESIFDRQWGIMFFLIFYCLFLLSTSLRKSEIVI